MSLAEPAAAPPFWQSLTRGGKAGLVVLVVAILCLALEASLPWLVKWPDAWTLPLTEWIGSVAGAVLGAMKPAMRFLSMALNVAATPARTMCQTLSCCPVRQMSSTSPSYHRAVWPMAAA